MMGGIMKGGHGRMHTTYSSSRRRWNVYVVMVIMLLVLGFALLGLTGIQRHKDRRVLNLLIKEKDHEIYSLHLLLQKERKHVKQVQSKTEEMKVKIYNLRAQKTQLNNRLLDLQSTISSLKEEQRAIELTFQEKQNEAKLLRERYIEIKDQNPRVKALTEIVQQKEAEIEDLKHHLHAGEASAIPSNVMAKANVSGNETAINMHERSMQGEEQGENGALVEGRSEITRNEKFERLENPEERNDGNGIMDADKWNDQVELKDNYDPQTGRISETGKEKNGHETEMIEDLGNEEQKPRDKYSEEIANMEDAHSRNISTSQGSDNQELGLHRVRLRGKNSYLRRAKAKRWKRVPNGQISAERAEEKPRSQGKVEDPIMGLRMQNESALKNQQFGLDDKLPGTEQDNVKAYIRGYNEENNGENSEDSPRGIMLRNVIENVDTDDMSHTNSSSMESHSSQAEMPRYSATNSDESGLSRKAMIQHIEQDGQSKERDVITEHTKIKPDDSQDDETNEDSDNTQVENFEETELGTIMSTKSAHNSEEEEQTDETDF